MLGKNDSAWSILKLNPLNLLDFKGRKKKSPYDEEEGERGGGGEIGNRIRLILI